MAKNFVAKTMCSNKLNSKRLCGERFATKDYAAKLAQLTIHIF